MFYVYVLRSDVDSGFYIGYSSNLRRRVSSHAQGAVAATSHRRPWRLIYYEAYLKRADALGREKYLKSGSGRRFLGAQLKHYLQKEPTGGRPREQSSATGGLLLRGHARAQQAWHRREEPAGLAGENFCSHSPEPSAAFAFASK